MVIFLSVLVVVLLCIQGYTLWELHKAEQRTERELNEYVPDGTFDHGGLV